MTSPLLESQRNENRELLAACPSLEFSVHYAKTLMEKSSIEDIASAMHLEIKNSIGRITVEAFNEVSYIPPMKRTQVLAYFHGHFFLDDPSQLQPDKIMSENYELLGYCERNGIIRLVIESKSILCFSDWAQFELYEQARKTSDVTHPIHASVQHSGVEPIIVFSPRQHIDDLLATTCQFDTATAEYALEKTSDALQRIMADALSKGSSQFNFIIEPTRKLLINAYVFKHEKSFQEITIEASERVEIVLAIDTLKARYRAVDESDGSCAYLTVQNDINPDLPARFGIRMRQAVLSHQREAVLIEIIIPLTDQLVPVQLGYSVKTSLNEYSQKIKQQIEKNLPCILCVPKSSDLRYLSRTLHNTLVEVNQKTSVSLVVDVDNAVYSGKHFLPVHVNTTSTEHINALSASAINLGNLHDKSSFERAVKLIESYQVIIAVTNASKEQLPRQLQKFAFQH